MPGNAAKKNEIPEAVRGILSSVLRRSGLDRDLARYGFVLHWPEIVGEAIAARTKPECIRNGALVIRVTDSTWAQELSLQKSVILGRLQKFLADDQIVTDVRFYVTGSV